MLQNANPCQEGSGVRLLFVMLQSYCYKLLALAREGVGLDFFLQCYIILTLVREGVELDFCT